MTREAFICDAVRTPIGRYAGALQAFERTTWLRRRSQLSWPGIRD